MEASSRRGRRLAGLAAAVSLATALLVTPALAATPLVGVAAAETLTARAQSGWLDPAWRYRRPVVVDNTSAQERTNQQVTIALNSANFDFSHSAGQDIRFTDSDGTTLLSHWTDSYDTTTQPAWFVVSVPVLPAATAKTIYLYYGNAAAPNVSSGAKTFAFYDGFERLTNARTPLTTPTYDGSGQATHPDVIHFPRGWHGFRYWDGRHPLSRWQRPAGEPVDPREQQRHQLDRAARRDQPARPGASVRPQQRPGHAVQRGDRLWMYYLDTRRAARCAGHQNQPHYNHNYSS